MDGDLFFTFRSGTSKRDRTKTIKREVLFWHRGPFGCVSPEMKEMLHRQLDAFIFDLDKRLGDAVARLQFYPDEKGGGRENTETE